MSRKRSNPAAAKQRRERIRAARYAERQSLLPPPAPASEIPSGQSFAAERAMREIHALLEGQDFNSVEEINARLAELTADGRLSERAAAWKRDDPEWRAQQLAYDAMESRDLEFALHLLNEAIQLDPHCIDAQRHLLALLPLEPGNRLNLLRELIESSEKHLGPAFFEENHGRFWGVTKTRPFMRALQDLGDQYIDLDRLDDAIAVFERMLELNPGDNQGLRYRLLPLYLAARQFPAIAVLSSKYPGECRFSAVFAWGRVLELWLAGRAEEAQAALLQARKVNRFAEGYLSGARRLPERLPHSYSPGDSDEAQVTAAELSVALRTHPEFSTWLQARR